MLHDVQRVPIVTASKRVSIYRFLNISIKIKYRFGEQEEGQVLLPYFSDCFPVSDRSGGKPRNCLKIYFLKGKHSPLKNVDTVGHVIVVGVRRWNDRIVLSTDTCGRTSDIIYLDTV